MWGGYQNILGFGMVALGLVIPFGLKLLSKSFEIYPSIVMPAGANVVNSDGDRFIFQQTKLLGIDAETKALRPLVNSEFIHPLPVQFLPGLLANEFGLNSSLKTTIKMRGGGKLERWKFAGKTENERELTRAWLRTRLKRAGCEDGKLIVRTNEMRATKGTRNVELIRVIDEKILALR